MKRNQHEGRCIHCGQRVAANEGELLTRRDPDTYQVTFDVSHIGPCPEGRATVEKPRWMVYFDAETHEPIPPPKGPASVCCTRFVDGPKPTADAAPVNEVAKAMEARR